LGIAYKKDINDLRESPALEIIKKLEKENVNISYYDPYIPKFTNKNREYKSLMELDQKGIKGKDIIIITTDHTKIDYEMVIRNAKIVFDTRNVIKFKSKKVEKL